MAVFHLRPMTRSDLLPVFNMRNDPDVCKNAHSPSPVSWEEHEAVFNFTDFPKYVYEGLTPCGYVEFRHDTINDNPDVKVWGFMVDKEYRGIGLSEFMLRDALAEIKKLGVKLVQGVVKKTNAASICLHKKLKFDIIGEDDETYTFALDLSRFV